MNTNCEMTYEERIKECEVLEIYTNNLLNLAHYPEGSPDRRFVSIDLDTMEVSFIHEEHNGPESWSVRDKLCSIEEYKDILWEKMSELMKIGNKHWFSMP